MSDAKMPQRYDLVGEYDSYMSPIEEGDYVRVEDVLAEIERLRAREASLWEALGLLTTLAPRMEIDTSDPMKMAKTIEATVRAALKEAQP
jgi:hypothetical protein